MPVVLLIEGYKFYFYVSDQTLTVDLQDGRVVSLPLRLFPTLAEAAVFERERWELCGAGTGIRWPLLDFDLSVAGLLRGEPEAPGVYRVLRRRREVAARSGGHLALAEAPTPAVTRRRRK